MTADVRAITIRRPWSTCIASTEPGAKRVENRGALTGHRGMLLIHEGVAVDADAYRFDMRVVALLNPEMDAHLTEVGAGAVIAVADLVDAHIAEDIPTLTGPAGTCCEPWGERTYNGRPARHLVLDNVRPLPKPVPCRGALGLWTPPEDVTAQVLSQLAGQGA